MKITTQKLAVSALLITANVLLTRVLAINTPIMKIGFGFAAVALCAMLYGPLWSMLVAAFGDFFGALIFLTGAYFPGFTLTAAMTGLIFGLCLYKRENTWLPPLTAAAANCVIVSFLLNTAMISLVSGAEYTVLLATRSIQLIVMLPVQAVTLLFLTKSRFIQSQVQCRRV